MKEDHATSTTSTTTTATWVRMNKKRRILAYCCLATVAFAVLQNSAWHTRFIHQMMSYVRQQDDGLSYQQQREIWSTEVGNQATNDHDDEDDVDGGDNIDNADNGDSGEKEENEVETNDEEEEVLEAEEEAEDDDNVSNFEIFFKLPTISNSTGIVHVIRTRFMQHQPSLIHLGKARLKLFESFYIRSLQRQTSFAFVCIIRTDPDLDPTLRESLISSLQKSGIPHLLVASNTEPKSYFDDIMIKNTIENSHVLSGSLADVKKYLQGPPGQRGPPHVLETRLDADDGLNKDFVATIQDEVKKNFNFAPRTWKLWCVGRHAEWQADLNFNQSHINNQLDDPAKVDPGKIFLRPERKFCVTPGMSIAFLGESKSIKASRGTGDHYKAFKQHKLCSQMPKKNKNCIHVLQLQVAAIRARTPTSAGMMDVVIDGGIRKAEYKKMISAAEKRQLRLWKKQATRFGFTRKDGKEINTFFYNNLKYVANEALEGQCTEGHSCKKSSQAKLKKIVAALS